MEGETEDLQALDKIVNTIMKHLSFLQYYPPEAASTRSKFIFATIIYIALQPALAVYANWQHWNFNSRVTAIDNLLYSLGILSLSIDVYLLSEKLRTLVNITKSKYKLYGIGSEVGHLSGEEAEILQEKMEIVENKDHKKSAVSKRDENIDLETGKFYDIESENPGKYPKVNFGSKSGNFTAEKDSLGTDFVGGKLKSEESRRAFEGFKLGFGSNLNRTVSESVDVSHHSNDTSAELIIEKSVEILEEKSMEFERSGTTSTGMCKIDNSIKSKMSGFIDEEGKTNLDGSRFNLSTNFNSTTYSRSDYFFEKKRKLVKEITLEGGRRSQTTAKIITYFSISFTFIPLSGFVSYFLGLEPVENLPLPFLIYSPFSFTLNIASFFEYFLLTLIEMFYVYYTSVLATTVHVLQLLSINNLLGEMRLFHLIVQEIGGEFEHGVRSEVNLRLAVRQLVEHHQTIFWKVKALNNGSNFRIFYVNSYVCLQAVFGIFIFLKGEFILKIKYGLMVITIVLMELIFSENGQRLQDEGEELRMALYECNWLGKPAWFTKVLQVMMIRSNNLPKVGLLNLFTLNRNNVTVVIRGAYSYFSLLNKISS
ncbi:hypothetical protein LSTR_LSTR009475 [Laodelphax striatellus]|uniref:Odorant receptor n=1 Tax=Laodelphax striatellus TaxID=195883 RepID=A0A482WGA6_LAOST|nr:hypothetical protein LSTR_LSTR009475 [Laodelphax striatellus]